MSIARPVSYGDIVNYNTGTHASFFAENFLAAIFIEPKTRDALRSNSFVCQRPAGDKRGGCLLGAI
jgi:hypothetical protein